MREKLDKFLEKLAVNYVLSPYETMPWSYYDEDRGITCSAEVRMGPDYEDIEAEIQFLYDDPPEEEDENAGDSDNTGQAPAHKTIIIDGREQILWMRAEPAMEDVWTPKLLRIKGKNYVNEFHEWEEKGCEFFCSCVQSIQMHEIPDIDQLIDDKMKDDSWGGGGRRGKIGKKSPKIKPAQLLGMKK